MMLFWLPTRSPDLSPRDYFLWAYVMSDVFKHQPTSIDGLKAAICNIVNKILAEITQKVVTNFRIGSLQHIAVQGASWRW